MTVPTPDLLRLFEAERRMVKVTDRQRRSAAHRITAIETEMHWRGVTEGRRYVSDARR